jgi:hypothetical protein
MSHSFKIYPFKSMVLGSLLLGGLCVLHANPIEGAADLPAGTPQQIYAHCRDATLMMLEETDRQLVDSWFQGEREAEDIGIFREQIAAMKNSIRRDNAQRTEERPDEAPSTEDIESIRRCFLDAVRLSSDSMGLGNAPAFYVQQADGCEIF